tara:strand:+ start:62 stop:421 length:360 start_codon:yes stop_codon:yes gene_type:complete
MFKYIFLLVGLLSSGCVQMGSYDPFYEVGKWDWDWSCRDHDEFSQVLIILDHCLENQHFVRSEVKMENNDQLYGALLNVSECHWESIIKMEDHLCENIDEVEVKRLKHFNDSDTGDTGN